MTGLFKLYNEENQIFAISCPIFRPTLLSRKMIISSPNILVDYLPKKDYKSDHDYFALIIDNVVVCRSEVYYEGFDITNERQVFLIGFGTFKKFRKHGYATMFLKMLQEYLCDKEILLGVEPDNDIAYRVYTKCKFKTIKENCFDNKYQITYNLMSNKK